MVAMAPRTSGRSSLVISKLALEYREKILTAAFLTPHPPEGENWEVVSDGSDTSWTFWKILQMCN